MATPEIFPQGRERYLEEARKLRRAPVVVRDPGGINGFSTLVNRGKQVRRTWIEIVHDLEDRGFGKMGPMALARALRPQVVRCARIRAVAAPLADEPDCEPWCSTHAPAGAKVWVVSGSSGARHFCSKRCLQSWQRAWALAYRTLDVPCTTCGTGVSDAR